MVEAAIILNELDIHAFSMKLDQDAKNMAIGEEGNRGMVADAFNKGLETMAIHAFNLLLEMQTKQCEERRLAERRREDARLAG